MPSKCPCYHKVCTCELCRYLYCKIHARSQSAMLSTVAYQASLLTLCREQTAVPAGNDDDPKYDSKGWGFYLGQLQLHLLTLPRCNTSKLFFIKACSQRNAAVTCAYCSMAQHIWSIPGDDTHSTLHQPVYSTCPALKATSQLHLASRKAGLHNNNSGGTARHRADTDTHTACQTS